MTARFTKKLCSCLMPIANSLDFLVGPASFGASLDSKYTKLHQVLTHHKLIWPSSNAVPVSFSHHLKQQNACLGHSLLKSSQCTFVTKNNCRHKVFDSYLTGRITHTTSLMKQCCRRLLCPLLYCKLINGSHFYVALFKDATISI